MEINQVLSDCENVIKMTTNDLLLMESNLTVYIKFEYCLFVRLSLFKSEIVRNEIDDSVTLNLF